MTVPADMMNAPHLDENQGTPTETTPSQRSLACSNGAPGPGAWDDAPGLVLLGLLPPKMCMRKRIKRKTQHKRASMIVSISTDGASQVRGAQLLPLHVGRRGPPGRDGRDHNGKV